MDHLFTVLVVWNAVVMVWRGIWGLGDLFFYPDVRSHSGLCSLAVGYGISLWCIPLQLATNAIYRLLSKRDCPLVLRVILEDLTYVFASVSAVHVWRGIWVLLDVHFLPDKFEISCWITHAVGIFGLMLILSARSIISAGFVITGEADIKVGAMFEIAYFQYFFSKPDKVQSSSSVSDKEEVKPLNGQKRDDSELLSDIRVMDKCTIACKSDTCSV